MEVVCHLGAIGTGEDRLLRSLLRDANALAARGVAVPGPGRYRKVLAEAVRARLRGAAAAGDREVVLEAALDGAEAARVVLVHPTVLGPPPHLFEGGQFLGGAEARAGALAALFAGDRLELHLALRNPAALLPDAFARSGEPSLEAWLRGAEPGAARWSEVVAALRRGAPGARLTVWCAEDGPLVWGEVLARMGGNGPSDPPPGRHDLAAALLTPEGARRLARHAARHPHGSPAEERRVVAAHLDRYARPEETWQEVDLPGWDHARVEALSRLYEEDAARVAGLEGVTFLRP